jgi:hypothetical protein
MEKINKAKQRKRDIKAYQNVVGGGVYVSE